MPPGLGPSGTHRHLLGITHLFPVMDQDGGVQVPLEHYVPADAGAGAGQPPSWSRLSQSIISM